MASHEKYVPTPEEIKKTEDENMDDKMKMQSEIREEGYNLGKKSVSEKTRESVGELSKEKQEEILDILKGPIKAKEQFTDKIDKIGKMLINEGNIDTAVETIIDIDERYNNVIKHRQPEVTTTEIEYPLFKWAFDHLDENPELAKAFLKRKSKRGFGYRNPNLPFSRHNNLWLGQDGEIVAGTTSEDGTYLTGPNRGKNTSNYGRSGIGAGL